MNVLRGEMSLVGPRPEDPAYVDFANPLHQRVFRARPGITGLAQLEFHDEAALLGGADPERTYREVILPAKLRIDADYLDRQSVRLDLEIMLRTVGAVFGRDGASTAAERAVEAAGDAAQPSDGRGGGGPGGPSAAGAEEVSPPRADPGRAAPSPIARATSQPATSPISRPVTLSDMSEVWQARPSGRTSSWVSSIAGASSSPATISQRRAQPPGSIPIAIPSGT